MKIKLKINFIILMLILYEEILFSILNGGGFQDLFLKISFSILYGLVIELIVNLFPIKKKKILYGIIFIIIPIIFIIYCLYGKNFETALTLDSILHSNQVMLFSNALKDIIIKNWYIILLFIFPTILCFIILKKYKFEEKIEKKKMLIIILLAILFYFISFFTICFDQEQEISSVKNLYFNINQPTENLRKFGVLTTLRLELQRKVIPFEEKKLYEYQDEEGNKEVLNKNDYNMLDINFSELIDNAENEEIKEIHQYIKNQKPTNKNTYTGKLAGKNLVVIVAESFSTLAIRKDITPTLYKLSTQGIQFKNFYTPLFPVSTADGEYLVDNSLLPAEGVWSIEKVSGNSIPYSYANVLKEQGYKTFAYHNYKYDYYKRDEYFQTMGYQKYLAQGNGLEQYMSFEKNPSSDAQMIQTTLKDYISEEKFLTYYMTMSGHMPYDETNDMVKKNWDKVKDLPYSDKAKAYLSTQIELDKAVEILIKTLKQEGKLENTVIMILGDHYPYGLTEEEIKELSSDGMDDYFFEKFHMPFLLYIPGEEQEDIIVNKYASSLDVLPTMLNLFGIKYDSRLLMGKDIFSNEESLVIFSDRSFITEKGKYDALSRKFTSWNGEEISKEYIKQIQQQIYHKYRYSRLILENNYYSFLNEE